MCNDAERDAVNDAVAILEEKCNRGESITAQDLIYTFGMVPTPDPQKVSGMLWNYATSNEHKFELWDGPFFTGDRRTRPIGAVHDLQYWTPLFYRTVTGFFT